MRDSKAVTHFCLCGIEVAKGKLAVSNSQTGSFRNAAIFLSNISVWIDLPGTRWLYGG
jgi:hypothetical protein